MWESAILNMAVQTTKTHGKHCRARCRRGIWIQVMTLHVLSTRPGETSHRIIWPEVDVFVQTSPKDHATPSAPHLQLQISHASALFKQIRVTGCSCQCHHLPDWDHASSTRPASRDLTREGVPRSNTFGFERAGKAASMQGEWRAAADSVTRWIKGHGDVDVKPEGAPCFLTSSWPWEHDLKRAHQKIEDSNLPSQPL